MLKESSFSKKVIKLMIPGMLQNLFMNMGKLIDNVMVGSLGATAIAGVAITNYIIIVFNIFHSGISSVAGIFMVQYSGIRDEKKMTQIFQLSLIINILCGILFFLLMTFLPEFLLGFFAINSFTIASAREYLLYLRWTLLIFPITYSITRGLKNCGYLQIPLYISVGAAIVNIIINYLLIYGNLGFDAMGVTGAGIATLLSRLLELFFTIIAAFLINSPVKLNLIFFLTIKKNMVLEFFSRGYPLLFNELIGIIGAQAIIVAYTQRLNLNIVALSISQSFGNLILIGVSGMGPAFTIILGDYLGSSRFEVAKNNSKKLLRISMVLGLCLSLLIYTSSFVVIDFFNVDLVTRNMAQNLILIQVFFSSVTYLLYGYYFIYLSGGDTRGILFLDSVFTWVIIIPLAFLLGTLDINLTKRFLLMQFVELLRLYIYIIRYNKGVWLKNLTT